MKFLLERDVFKVLTRFRTEEEQNDSRVKLGNVLIQSTSKGRTKILVYESTILMY